VLGFYDGSNITKKLLKHERTIITMSCLDMEYVWLPDICIAYLINTYVTVLTHMLTIDVNILSPK